MSDDFVQRLRASDGGDASLREEAADRIEALEADLADTEQMLDTFGRISPQQYQKELAVKAARIEALEAALQQISLSLDGTDEWTDQETMVAYVVNRVKDAADRIEALEAAARAQMATILGTIGGTVEGHPTSEINYLQRLRQLVEIEARAARAARAAHVARAALAPEPEK